MIGIGLDLFSLIFAKGHGGGSVGSPILAADGATWPIYGVPVGYPWIYDSVSNSIFGSYEGWTGLVRVTRVFQYDLTSQEFTDTYRAGAPNKLNDSHGVPAIAVDSNGYIHLYFGPHVNLDFGSPDGRIIHYVSRSPRDVTSWVPAIPVSEATQYPTPANGGAQLLQRYISGTLDFGIGYQLGTVAAGGAISYAAPVNAFKTGDNTRLYWSSIQVVGDDVTFIAIQSPYDNSYFRKIYFFRWNTNTLSWSNYSGSRTDAVGALPVSAANLETHYKIIDPVNASGTGAQNTDFCYDSNGNPHVIWAECTTIEGDTFTVYHSANFGAGWTAATAVGGEGWTLDMPVKILSMGSGIVRAYWSDKSAGPLGAITYAERSSGSGGTWGTPVEVQIAVDFSFNAMFKILNGPSTANIGWFQTVPAADSESDTAEGIGTLKGYARGNSDIIRRQSINFAPDSSIGWSPLYKHANLTISTITTITATGNGSNQNALANVGGLNGTRIYIEFEIVQASTVTAVAFASVLYPSDGTGFGTGPSFAYYNDGTVYQLGVLATLETFTTGDRIRAVLRQDTKTVFFAVNGGDWNDDPTCDPTTGLGGIPYDPHFVEMLPGATLSTTGGSIRICPLPADWEFSAPNGTIPVGYTEADVNVIAPILSDGEGTASGETTADLEVTTNTGNGTIYWIVTESSDEPTAVQIRNGLDADDIPGIDTGSQAVSSSGVQSISGGATGLDAATQYYVYFMQQDSSYNFSNVPNGGSFITEGSGVTTTWDPSNKATAITLSGGNLTAAANTNNVGASVRATVSKSSGKYYCEFLCDVRAAANMGLGVCNASKTFSAGQWLGIDNNSLGAYSTGSVYLNNVNIGGWGGFIQGEIFCMAVDIDNRRIWLRRTNGNWNNSGTANPATNTGGYNISAITGALFPAVELEDNTDKITVNFGAIAYTYSVPSGFGNWV